MPMDTSGSDLILEALREHALAYVPKAPLTGETLEVRLGGRLYQVAPPDTLAYPYGLLRFMNRRTSGATHGERETVDLEVLLYDRPRKHLRRLERAADVYDQAMLRYVGRDTLGIVFSRDRQRDTLPPYSSPADREVCAIRLVYPLVSWPAFLFTDD